MPLALANPEVSGTSVSVPVVKEFVPLSWVLREVCGRLATFGGRQSLVQSE
jgi:hypothetical protein